MTFTGAPLTWCEMRDERALKKKEYNSGRSSPIHSSNVSGNASPHQWAKEVLQVVLIAPPDIWPELAYCLQSILPVDLEVMDFDWSARLTLISLLVSI